MQEVVGIGLLVSVLSTGGPPSVGVLVVDLWKGKYTTEVAICSAITFQS